MRRSLASAHLLVAALSVIPACRQIAGIQSRESVETQCVSCVQGDCASEVAACAATSTCDARLDCTLGCDPLGTTCDPSCETEAVVDVGALGAFVACRASACAAACDVTCGGIVPVTPTPASAACAACTASQCCAQASACATSADCVSGLECVRATSVPDGVVTCTDVRYAAGATAYHALDDCIAGGCSDKCDVGSDWACVGSVNVPTPATDSIQFTLVVVEASSQSVPIAGLSVRGCSSTDATCATPAAPPVTTNPQGAATLTLPTSADGQRTGFTGYFEVSDPNGVYTTTLGFTSVPLTQDGASTTIIAPTLAIEQTIAKLVGQTFDPTLGGVIVTATDCVNVPAPGVTFTVEAGGVSQPVYYTFGTFPSQEAKMTDGSGTALAANMPPGAVTVTATSGALGQLVGRAQFFTRAGAISLLRLSPTP